MDADFKTFVRGSFPSVWALELLLLLVEQDRTFTRAELVALLRASDAVIAKCAGALLAAGLLVEEDADRLRYAPASPALADLVARTAALYRSRPAAVRRLIVAGSPGSLEAFADAFRLRKDSE